MEEREGSKGKEEWEGIMGGNIGRGRVGDPPGVGEQSKKGQSP